MSNSERRNYARRMTAYRNPERRAEDAIYERLHEFAGEILTIESMTIKTTALSMRNVTVRYDADTAFDITLYHADLKQLEAAGYELPQTIGTYIFKADIVCKWVEEHQQYRLTIDTVLPKEDTMETMQPESNDPVLAVVETSAIAVTPDYTAIIMNLTALRDLLATDTLGLSGGALETAIAKANAAHYIDNAIGSLQRAFPVPLINSNDITERIPVIMDTASESEAA